jgi:Flp pilus assembly protein TadD
VAAPPPPDDTEEFAMPQRGDSRRRVEEARAVARTDPKRRRALLRAVLASDPKYEPALEQLSLALLHDENHDEAREVSARCLAVSPDNDTCRMVSNYALPRGPETDRVGLEARACLEGTPNDPKCLAATIGYDVLTGKIDDATHLMKTLDQVAPGAKQTLFAKARLESVAGHYDDARHDLEEACQQGLEQACFRAEALRGEGW